MSVYVCEKYECGGEERVDLKPLVLGLYIGQGLGFKDRKPESWPYTCMSRIPYTCPSVSGGTVV